MYLCVFRSGVFECEHSLPFWAKKPDKNLNVCTFSKGMTRVRLSLAGLGNSPIVPVDDSVDREWLELQSQLREDRKFAEDTERAIQDLGIENDEQLMNIGDLRDAIAEKEAANEQKRIAALEVQERFLWDLSFAVKKCLVEERGATTMQGVAISQVPVKAILDAAEVEDPQPHEWMTWIEEKFQQQQP